MRIINYIFIIFSLCWHTTLQATTDKSIYKVDSRISLSQAGKYYQKLSPSIGIMVSDYYLIYDTENSEYELFAPPSLQEKKAVCSDTPFAQDYAVGTCSGFLIAPNKLVTAGHCVPTQYECSEFRWIFNLNQDADFLSEDQVYRCKSIQRPFFSWGSTRPDMVIVNLDRPVKNYRHFKIGSSKKTKVRDQVFAIGSPSGLSLKLSSQATVTKKSKKDFLTNLDLFKGNSGSPVFEKKTGNVIGMVVSGGRDFVYNQWRRCFELNYQKRAQEKVIWLDKALEDHF